MLDLLFSQSPAVQLAVFSLHGLISLLFALIFMRALSAKARDITALIPVGPSFASVTAIFSLLLAFHAAAIWSHRQQAERAFVQAQSAFLRFDDLVSPNGLDAPGVRAALHEYVEHAVEDEWLALGNKRMSETAERAFLDLETTLLRHQLSQPESTQAQLNTLLNDIARSRAERLWIGEHHTDGYVWLSVLLIGLISHFAIAAIHLDRPRAGALMLSLFAATTTIAYWSLGVMADPYRDSSRLNPEVLVTFKVDVPEE